MCTNSEQDIDYAIQKIATAITANGAPGTDAAGGSVSSLTEAVMGMTSALCKIADGIHRIADVYDDRDDIGRAIERVADEIERYNDTTSQE